MLDQEWLDYLDKETMTPDTELEILCSFCGKAEPETNIIGFPACTQCSYNYKSDPLPFEAKIAESF